MSLRSMTGFGRARGAIGSNWVAELTARSVNHRFLDVTVRVREVEAALEPVVRRVFSRRLARGKVDVTLRLARTAPAVASVSINEGLLEALIGRLAELSRRYPLRGELALADLISVPQLVSIDSATEEFSGEEESALETLAEEVAAALVVMRETEGRLIATEISKRLAVLRGHVDQLTLRRDEIVRASAATIRERVRFLFPEVPMESGRLEQEAALVAERSDVAEELQRLAGHLEQLGALIEKSREPVGKKLDFLSQEVLREINTLGSKARDLQLVREVLDMKSETEKIREQVQNVE